MNADVQTCAVIQGNIRRGTREVIDFATEKFDHVILSTWEGEDTEGIPTASCHVIFNKKPSNPGYTNRNYQRLSTAAGITYAESLGCTHVLKLRTDMLPTKLEVSDLLVWAHYEVPKEFPSRIVTCAFRNLTVREDWFSSIPDLFAFGDLKMMKMLWSADSHDFLRSMNLPTAMTAEAGNSWTNQPESASLYCSETELYAWFRARLEEHVGRQLNHYEIAKNLMYLIDHNRLGICWFGDKKGFRSITQALEHPWWTPQIWKYGRPTIAEKGYQDDRFVQKIIRKYATPIVIRNNLKRQLRWYQNYMTRRLTSA